MTEYFLSFHGDLKMDCHDIFVQVTSFPCVHCKICTSKLHILLEKKKTYCSNNLKASGVVFCGWNAGRN